MLDDYFAMSSKLGIVGAYDWLRSKGYGTIADDIKDARQFNTNSKRLLLVGVVYKTSLTSDFMNTCWIQGNRDATQRTAQMETWLGRFFQAKRSEAMAKFSTPEFIDSTSQPSE